MTGSELNAHAFKTYDFVRGLLAHTTSTLRHFELVAVESTVYREPHTDPESGDLGFPLFSQILASLHFDRLEFLVLREWMFHAHELQNFLLAHSATLREVHLVCCYCDCDYGAWKVPSAISLTGAETYGMEFAEYHREEELHFHGQSSLEALLLHGRGNAIQRRVAKEKPRRHIDDFVGSVSQPARSREQLQWDMYVQQLKLYKTISEREY